MKMIAAVAMAVVALSGAAQAEEISAEAQARIDALLAEMQCQLNGEIEVEDDGFELDDVFCADGKQYDVELNADFEVVEKREE
jgi:hypothetical protein